MPRRSCIVLLHCCLLPLGLGFGAWALAAPPRIADELQRLSSQYNFQVKGEEHLEDATGRSEGEDILARLRLLLERFDHIIVQAPAGGVERVIILGRTTPPPAPAVVEVAPPPAGTGVELPTTRAGSSHMVEVSLEGPGGRRITRSLLVDTGADTLVLPGSLIAALGIAEDSLQERDVHTANGTARARVGQLPAVWLATLQVPDVEVAFLDDDKLNVSGLLGMSVLGRYQMTIDDQHNRLTLNQR